MKKPFGYWTKEKVFEEARKYQTKNEFNKSCSGAYNVAWKNGWIKEMTWFERPIAHNKKWDKKSVFEKSMEYQTRKDFKKSCSSAYNVAYANGWLDEMDWLKVNHYIHWNKENLFEEARKYQTRK